jgi:hypothetical protein
MLDTNIYKSEFQNMLRKKGTSIQALKEGNNGVTNGYIIPGRDMGLFHEAMEKDCLFRKYATKIALDRAEGTIIAVHSTGTAEVTGSVYLAVVG